MNYYVVIKGREGLNIYDMWKDCENSIKNFSGAVHHKWKTEEEVLEYMLENGVTKEDILKNYEKFKVKIDISSLDGQVKKEEKVEKKVQNTVVNKPMNNELGYTNPNKIVSYIDGSFNENTNIFGYGVIFLHDKALENVYDKVINKEYILFERYEGTNNPEVATMRQIGGEIKACMIAVKTAIEKGYKEIDIYHDLEGTAKWYTGEFKTKNDYTKAYKEYLLKQSSKIKINFFKVKAHDKDKWNKYVDKLAKKSVGII